MKIIDITNIFDENTPVYPDDFKTHLIKYKTIEKDHYNAFQLNTSLHTGTHIDMPIHLLNDKRTAKDFSADNFIGRGVLLDVRGEKSVSMKEKYKDAINEKDIVLLYTGHDKFYNDKKYFSDYPSVDEDLADFLLTKNIKMLGMDLPSPDYPPFAIHKKLLEKGVFILENLTNLEELLTFQAFEVIALPLKISAEASLVRAICREINLKR